MPIRAVTFDFWNTLVAESPDSRRVRRDGYLAALSAMGGEHTPEQVEASMFAGWQWFEDRWRAGVVTSPVEAATRAAADLGVEDLDGAVSAFVEVIERGSDPAAMRTAPGIGGVLEELRRAGVACGIICDVGMTPSTRLRQYLEHHGLLEYFTHWSFSDEVGVFKPDARIFAHAADGLDRPAPAEMAHVGDLRRTDVAGARAQGWATVRYSGLNDDGDDDIPDADHVIDDHARLIDALFPARDR